LLLVLGGSLLMIAGALAISTAVASAREHLSRNEALERECERYGLNYQEVLQSQSGDEFGSRSEKRNWWDYAIVAGATGLFLWLALNAVVPPLAMNLRWAGALGVILLVALVGGGWALWRQTRFS
jgi:hypothetical protein